MIPRQFTHCMLRPSDIPATTQDYKVVGVFNPGVVKIDGQVVLIVRVVEQPIETRENYLASPRLYPDKGMAIDWLDPAHIDTRDPRIYLHRTTGLQRLRFISHLRVYRSRDGKTIDNREPQIIMPSGPYEEFGIEDPRITPIGDTFYITYVAVSHHGVSTCLLSTKDFESFIRHGIIFCPENKDVLLFPQKIAGRYVAMHRPVASIRFRPPEIWLARSPDLIHWGEHQQLLGGEETIDMDRIGGSTPPIRTSQGWLTLYHGSQRTENVAVGKYTAKAILLDLDGPAKILAQSNQPILWPTEPFETQGFVDNVIFPTAMIEQGDDFYVYYGAADENLGVVGFSKQDLMGTLESV